MLENFKFVISSAMTNLKSSLKLIYNRPLSTEADEPTVEHNLWLNRPEQGHGLHYAVQYHGTLKPELTNYYLNKYSEKGSIVLDPFCGSGVVPLQASLLGRIAWASDINQLAVRITQAKLKPAGLDEVVLFLTQLNLQRPISLSGFQEFFAPFYHPDTYRELVNLKNAINRYQAEGVQNRICNFVELLVFSRLHGHAPSHFSTYSSPQVALSPSKQLLLNKKRRQTPEYKAISPRLIQRTAQLLKDGISSEFLTYTKAAMVKRADAQNLTWVNSNSVDLVLTSLPLPDNFDYISNYWLENWFSGFSDKFINISLPDWVRLIRNLLSEMLRVLKPSAYAVLELSVELSGKHNVKTLEELVIQEAKALSINKKRFCLKEVVAHKPISATKYEEQKNNQQKLIIFQVS